MDLEQINRLLSQTRDQSFRKKSQSKIDQDQSIVNSRSLVTASQARKIYELTWSEHRSTKLYHDLAKKFNLKYWTVDSIANNKLNQLQISHTEHDNRLKEWQKKYGFCYAVHTPGSDLLDYYDWANERRGLSQQLLLPPSTIFHYRFIEPDWTAQQVKKLFPHIKGNTLLSLLRTRLTWLTQETSTRVVCTSQRELLDYVKEQTGHSAMNHIYSDTGLSWHGHLSGWSFHNLNNPKYKI